MNVSTQSFSFECTASTTIRVETPPMREVTGREALSPEIEQLSTVLKDSRAGGRPRESQEAVKVFSVLYTELRVVLLLLFSGDWQTPPFTLTACLCVTRDH